MCLFVFFFITETTYPIEKSLLCNQVNWNQFNKKSTRNQYEQVWLDFIRNGLSHYVGGPSKLGLHFCICERWNFEEEAAFCLFLNGPLSIYRPTCKVSSTVVTMLEVESVVEGSIL